MNRRFARFLIFVGILALAAPAARVSATLRLTELAVGLQRPLALAPVPDGSGRLFVAEQEGRVWILDAEGKRRRRPFLDLSGRLPCCGGQGLLGFVPHPDFGDNGFVFINYTDAGGDNVISRLRAAGPGRDRAQRSSERELYRIQQPTPGHNAGQLAFGPDGYLYLGSGDGSNGGDPGNNAQSLASPLGKILRFDVTTVPATAPPDNPFVGDPEALPEIWAYGFRNPWRFSFDRTTGDLLVGDVGQQRTEEINFQPAASGGGENYGWRLKEGSDCFEPAEDCDDGALTAAIIEYGHDLGCSVTGGFRYRGRREAPLRGLYVYGDFCSGTIWGARPNANGRWVSRVLEESGLPIVSFAETEAGELLLLDFSGRVLAISSLDVFADGFESGDLTGWRRRGDVEVVPAGLAGSDFALSASAAGGAAVVAAKTGGRLADLEAGLVLRVADLGLSLEEDVLTVADGRGEHLALTLEQPRPRRFRLALYVNEAGGRRLVGTAPIGKRHESRVKVAWRRESSAGAGDGLARLTVGGRMRGELGDLRTGRRAAVTVRLGFPSGTKGASGRLLADEVVLSRLP